MKPSVLVAEFLAQGVAVEGEADVEGGGQRPLEGLEGRRREALGPQRGVIDAGRALQGAMADGVADDLLDLRLAVAQGLERQRHHAVDDLEIAAAGELLELDQREVGLDAGGVAIHHQADGAGRRDHRGLGVAIAMLLAEGQRQVPGALGGA